MGEPTPRPSPVGPRLRWLIWGVFLVVWTAALLRPEPVEVGREVMADEARFSLGKTLHVTAYAGLAVLSAWQQVSAWVRWGLLAFLSAHAMSTEYFQRFVPPRSGTLLDVGLDHLGLALGVLLSWKWWRS